MYIIVANAELTTKIIIEWIYFILMIFEYNEQLLLNNY